MIRAGGALEASMGRRLVTLVVAVVLLAPALAAGQSLDRLGAGPLDELGVGAIPTARFGDFYFGLGLVQAWGDAGFTISGRDATVGRFRSVIEFPMDGTYFVLESGIEGIGPGFGAHLRYGSSGNIEGTTTDSDYAAAFGSSEFIKSLSSTDGENVFLTLDVSYRLHERTGKDGERTRLDVFVGYALQDAALEVSDVHTVIEDGLPADWWSEGLAATYDMEFRGVRVGVRGEIALSASSTVVGCVAVLPYVKADGFGQWILRRKAFDHNATGFGLDATVRYKYAVSSSVRLWAGAGYTHLRGTDGTDEQFSFGGHPIGTVSLDELQSQYGFVMIGAELRF
jgi:hypothetical protein